jgi:DNA-binding transcriptional MocR family regulator
VMGYASLQPADIERGIRVIAQVIQRAPQPSAAG